MAAGDTITLTWDERIARRIAAIQLKVAELRRQEAHWHRRFRPHRSTEGMYQDIQAMRSEISEIWRVIRKTLKAIEETNEAMEKVRRGLMGAVLNTQEQETKEERRPSPSLLKQLLAIFTSPTARRLGLGRPRSAGGGIGDIGGVLISAAGRKWGGGGAAGATAAIAAIGAIAEILRLLIRLPKEARGRLDEMMDLIAGLKWFRAYSFLREEMGPAVHLVRKLGAWRFFGDIGFEKYGKNLFQLARGYNLRMREAASRFPWLDFLRAGGMGVFLRRNLMVRGLGGPNEAGRRVTWPETGLPWGKPPTEPLKSPAQVAEEIHRRGGTVEFVSRQAQTQLQSSLSNLGRYFMIRTGEEIPWLLRPDVPMQQLSNALEDMLNAEIAKKGGG